MNIMQTEGTAEQAQLLQAVGAVMRVSTVTAGRPGDGFVYRFTGILTAESHRAYAQLEPRFSTAGYTLVFRENEGEHVVLAMPGMQPPKKTRAAVNLLLFLLTLFSMLFSGAMSAYRGPTDLPFSQLVLAILSQLDAGIPFATSLLAILAAHEFGHYFAARRHGTAVTLPYFIPFPGSPFGTMGAFIQLQQPPKNKRVLLDIGLAGPLAGLVVAIPVLLYGLYLSPVDVLPMASAMQPGQVLEGNSLLYLAAKYLVKGELLPMPLSYEGMSPLLYWARYLLVGQPLPFGGRDILLHPVAWAGWAGLLVTSLNLIPVGQLDGGHILFSLFGKRVRRIWPVMVILLFVMGMVWSGWYLWAAFIFVLGRNVAQPLDAITRLDPRRRAWAVFGLLVALLVFIPVPLVAF